MAMSKELEAKVFAYSKEHPVANLAIHGAPIAMGSMLSVMAALIGAGTLVPVIMVLSLLVLMTNMKAYNKKALAAPSDAEVEQRQLEAKDKAIKSWVESADAGRGKCQSEYDCPNYDTIQFELKLAEEGVVDIGSVSVCDLDDCLLCPKIRRKQREAEEEKARAERAARQAEHEKMMREIEQRRAKRARESDAAQLSEMADADADRVRTWQETALDQDVEELYSAASGKSVKRVVTRRAAKKVIVCPNHEEKVAIETFYVGMCPRCRLADLKRADAAEKARKKAEAAAKRAAAKAAKEAEFERRRHMNVAGIEVIRPLDVPEGAVPSFLNGRDIDPLATHSFIVWKWTVDGKETLHYKQPVVDDVYCVTSDDGFYKSFHSITDVQTGEFLGDYVGNSDRFKPGGYLGWSEELNREYGDSK